MTQSTASAPFKESTHIDENAESIYGANRSASNAATEFITSAETASARSTNGGRGGGDRVDSSDRRPKSRSSNSARNVNVKAEAQSQVSTNNPVRDLRDTGNESEMPGGEGEQSNERRAHKRSSRKESE